MKIKIRNIMAIPIIFSVDNWKTDSDFESDWSSNSSLLSSLPPLKNSLISPIKSGLSIVSKSSKLLLLLLFWFSDVAKFDLVVLTRLMPKIYKKEKDFWWICEICYSKNNGDLLELSSAGLEMDLGTYWYFEFVFKGR